MLDIRGVSKDFGQFQALRDVSLQVGAGEVVGLIGPNGAGKSTLVNIVAGALRPSSGEVRAEGHRITGLGPHEIARRGIGRMVQIPPNAANTPVEDYVMIGALFGTADRERNVSAARHTVDSALKLVGLAHRRAHPADELNLVDRKRMELARVLAMRPRILLLDETVAGLDPTDVETMLAIIERLKGKGLAVLLIEHVVEALARVADLIAVLVSGELLISGEPEQVLAHPRVIEAYLGSTKTGVEDRLLRGEAGGAAVIKRR